MINMNKKLLLLMSLVVIIYNDSVFAFGGGGRNRTHEWYKHGVDSIGVHIGGSKQADVLFSCEKPCEWKNKECVCESKINKFAKMTVDGWTGDEISTCDVKEKLGICSVCLTIENTIGEEGRTEFCADSNSLCDAGQMCAEGICRTLIGDGCAKNSDCRNQLSETGEACGLEGCYCNYGHSYQNNEYPSNRGTCMLKDKDKYEFTYEGKKRFAFLTTNDLWSSKNLCEAWNMRLMTWNELNCPVSENRVTLVYTPGSHFQRAFEAIYGETDSAFFTLGGYTTEYALVKASDSIMGLYSATPFIICR